ncbi:MAG: M48 family metalloprotease [Acetobacteraceae bacterium]
MTRTACFSRVLPLLVAGPLIGCGPQYNAPAVSQTSLTAAQQEIQSAGALQTHDRSVGEQKALLQRVAARVAPAARAVCKAEQGGAQECSFSVAYDPSSEANAYASGDTQVGVTAGMLQLVDNDAELAAVLAHEFGHHIANHIARAQTRTALGALAGAAIGSYTGVGDLSGVGAQVGRLTYSKADEREADYLAAYITARAGYDLDRAEGIWTKLAASGGGRMTAGLLDTHPAGPERLAAWNAAQQEIAQSPNSLPRTTASSR